MSIPHRTAEMTFDEIMRRLLTKIVVYNSVGCPDADCLHIGNADL